MCSGFGERIRVDERPIRSIRENMHIFIYTISKISGFVWTDGRGFGGKLSNSLRTDLNIHHLLHVGSSAAINCKMSMSFANIFIAKKWPKTRRGHLEMIHRWNVSREKILFLDQY